MAAHSDFQRQVLAAEWAEQEAARQAQRNQCRANTNYWSFMGDPMFELLTDIYKDSLAGYAQTAKPPEHDIAVQQWGTEHYPPSVRAAEETHKDLRQAGRTANVPVVTPEAPTGVTDHKDQ